MRQSKSLTRTGNDKSPKLETSPIQMPEFTFKDLKIPEPKTSRRGNTVFNLSSYS